MKFHILFPCPSYLLTHQNEKKKKTNHKKSTEQSVASSKRSSTDLWAAESKTAKYEVNVCFSV